MGNRMLVQNSVPVVDVPLADGSTVPGVAISGTFDIISQRPVSLTYDLPVDNVTNYSTGDTLGEQMRFVGAAYDEDNLGITIDSLVIRCVDALTPDLDIVLFSTVFTEATDNAPFSVSALDFANVIGIIKVAAADWRSLGNYRVATLPGIGLNVVLDGVDLYAQVVARGTIDFTSADALSITLGIRRD